MKYHRPHSSSVPIAFFKTADLEVYICTECGYAKFFADEKGLVNTREYTSLPYEKTPPPRWISCMFNLLKILVNSQRMSPHLANYSIIFTSKNRKNPFGKNPTFLLASRYNGSEVTSVNRIIIF
ncbi:MAG: hypothetical protein ACFFBQ_08890 [Promethearchaeota archaeon]